MVYRLRVHRDGAEVLTKLSLHWVVAGSIRFQLSTVGL